MRNKLLLTLAAGTLLMLGSAATADAQYYRSRSRCEQRIRQLERNVNHYERRDGYFSRNARRERQKLYETRRNCGYAWWSGRWIFPFPPR